MKSPKPNLFSTLESLWIDVSFVDHQRHANGNIHEALDHKQVQWIIDFKFTIKCFIDQSQSATCNHINATN